MPYLKKMKLVYIPQPSYLKSVLIPEKAESYFSIAVTIQILAKSNFRRTAATITVYPVVNILSRISKSIH